MIIQDHLHVSYDMSGNVIITIPKVYFQDTEKRVLLQSIDQLIQVEKNTMNRPNTWSNDSASALVGIGQSDISDGSVHHDQYIYGEA